MRLALLLALALACRAPAAAVCPAVTRVGMSDLGFSSFRTAGAVGGISVDVANELARRTGCKLEFVWFPRGRLFLELEAGRIDITMGAVRSPERDAYAAFLPYASVQYDLILSKRVAGRYTSLADFVARSQARLNVTRGMQYGPGVDAELATLAKAGRLETVSDFETVFNKLDAGRADGTLATLPIYSSHLKQSGREDEVVIITLPESPLQFIGLYASRKTVAPELVRQYAAALKAITAERMVPAIYARYIDEPTVRQLFRQGMAPLAQALDAAQK